MTTAIQTRLNASITAFSKLKPVKSFDLEPDKKLSNIDNAILIEASLDRLNVELDLLKGHIQRFEMGINEWSALIRKSESQATENAAFKKFSEEQKLDEVFDQASSHLQELLDLQTTMMAKAKLFRDKADRDLRQEMRTHAQQLAAAAPTTTSTSTPGVPPSSTFYQLPTLKIRPFKGDRREWPAFEEAFKNAIDLKPGSKIEKLNLLRTLLHGEPETLIAGLRLDDANYEVAKKMLQETYGDKGSYLRTLHTDLANLKRCQNLEDTQHFLMELERLAREMANIRENIEGPAIYLALEKKLNKNFLRVILAKKAEDPDGWTTTKFRETLREAVHTESRIKEVAAEYGLEKPSNSGKKDKNSSNQQKSHNVAAVASGPASKKKGNRKGRKGSGKRAKEQPDSNQAQAPSQQSSQGQNRQAQTQQSRPPQGKSHQSSGQSRPQQRQFTQRDNRQPNQRLIPITPCGFCGGEHWHNQCEKYKTVAQRTAVAKERGLCLRCLRTGHLGPDCLRPHRCYNCRLMHPTALCRAGPVQGNTMSSLTDQTQHMDSSQDQSSQEIASQNCLAVQSRDTHVLLKTLRCTIFNPGDPQRSMIAVIFIDPGAQRSFVRTEIAEKLGLKSLGKEECNLSAFGDTKSKYYCTDRMRLGFLCKGGDRMTVSLTKVNFIVNDLPVIPADKLPDRELYAEKLKLPNQLSTPDILLGMDVWQQLHYWEEEELPSGFLLCQTILGRLICGKGQINGPSPPAHVTFVLAVHEYSDDERAIIEEKDLELDAQLHMFFGLNMVGISEPSETAAAEEAEVMRKFKENLTFLNGRYQVGLPFNDRIKDLPTNFRQAKARLISTIRKLRELNLINQYQAIFDEQLEKGVIEIVPDPKQSSGPVHYLPHRAVVREDKETTKVRIVLDASARPKGIIGAPSLNDCLHKGPLLLNELIGILLRFRRMRKLVIADIEKAFLQMGVRLQDRDCTRLLWVMDPHNADLGQFMETIVFRFCRVSFGLTVSPFLLNATIREHLSLYESLVALIILLNLYSDNVIIDIDQIQTETDGKLQPTIKAICEEAKQMFSEAGMRLRQFFCSHPNEIADFPAEELASDQQETKVLGIKWNNATDKISISLTTFQGKMTKRTCLSQLAKPYDPMGMFSPVLLPGKLFMRKLYEAEYDWDHPLTPELEEEWKNLMAQWVDTNGRGYVYEYPRYIAGEELEIHCFVDASGSGLGITAYARTELRTEPQTFLLFAKSLVKPAKISINESTIPKMELQALTFGVETSQFLQKQMNLEPTQVTLWSDSHCTIDRLKEDKKYDRFVTNRVIKIRGHYIVKHIKGEDNPADIASRGSSPIDLMNNRLWRDGPDWLRKPKSEWPEPMVIYVPGEEIREEPDDVTYEVKAVVIVVESIIDPFRFSIWPRLRNSMAYVFRFIDRIKLMRKLTKAVELDWKCLRSEIPPLEYNELRKSEHYLVQIAQKQFPATEDQKQGLRIVEINGLQHCQGRLNEAKIRREEKTPIFLPNKARMTRLIILHTHRKEGKHLGANTILALIRQRYWIPQGRKTIDKLVQADCLVCRKFHMKPYDYPEMPDLPRDRILKERPFGRCGVDYFGPVRLKSTEGEPVKKYVALYTCLVTRAIHLEMAEDYSAAAFLHTFRRFCARRGKPIIMYSDNAGNFTLGAKVIQELWQRAIIEETAQEGVQWQFITPRAPWRGGAWERLIGVTKHALKRSIGKALPKVEEYSTLLCEVESIVNSRPITFQSEKNMDKVLRPIDFLLPYQNVEIQLPTLGDDPLDPDYAPDEKANKKELTAMFQWANKRLDGFWRLWREDYLLSLRERNNKPIGEIARMPREGDIVLVDWGEEIERSKWPLAKIVQLLGGRTAKILANGRYFYRSVNQIFPLEEPPDASSPATTTATAIISKMELLPEVTARLNVLAQKLIDLNDEDNNDYMVVGPAKLEDEIREEIESAEDKPGKVKQLLWLADRHLEKTYGTKPIPSSAELWKRQLAKWQQPSHHEEPQDQEPPPPPPAPQNVIQINCCIMEPPRMEDDSIWIFPEDMPQEETPMDEEDEEVQRELAKMPTPVDAFEPLEVPAAQSEPIEKRKSRPMKRQPRWMKRAKPLNLNEEPSTPSMGRTIEWFNNNFTIPRKNPLTAGKYRLSQKTGKVEKTPKGIRRLGDGGFNMLSKALQGIGIGLVDPKQEKKAAQEAKAEMKIGPIKMRSKEEKKLLDESKAFFKEQMQLWENKKPFERSPQRRRSRPVPSFSPEMTDRLNCNELGKVQSSHEEKADPKEGLLPRLEKEAQHQWNLGNVPFKEWLLKTLQNGDFEFGKFNGKGPEKTGKQMWEEFEAQMDERPSRSPTPPAMRPFTPSPTPPNSKTRKNANWHICQAEPAQLKTINLSIHTACDGPEHANCPKTMTFDNLGEKARIKAGPGIVAVTMLKAMVFFWIVRNKAQLHANLNRIITEGTQGSVKEFWANHWKGKPAKAILPTKALVELVQLWTASCTHFSNCLSEFRYGPLKLLRVQGRQTPFGEFVNEFTTLFEEAVDQFRAKTFFPGAYMLRIPIVCVGENMAEQMANTFGGTAKWFSHDGTVRLSSRMVPSFKAEKIIFCLDPNEAKELDETFSISLEEAKAARLEVNIILAKRDQKDWKEIQAKAKQQAKALKAGLYVCKQGPHEKRKIANAIMGIENEPEEPVPNDTMPSPEAPKQKEAPPAHPKVLSTMMAMLMLVMLVNPAAAFPIWKPIVVGKRGPAWNDGKSNDHFKEALAGGHDMPTDPQARNEHIQRFVARLRDAHNNMMGYQSTTASSIDTSTPTITQTWPTFTTQSTSPTWATTQRPTWPTVTTQSSPTWATTQRPTWPTFATQTSSPTWITTQRPTWPTTATHSTSPTWATTQRPTWSTFASWTPRPSTTTFASWTTQSTTSTSPTTFNIATPPTTSSSRSPTYPNPTNPPKEVHTWHPEPERKPILMAFGESGEQAALGTRKRHGHP